MDRLIACLLDATTIERGMLTVCAERSDAGALVRDVVATMQPQAAEASVRLETEVSDALPAVRCDRDRTFQVVANLLGNAIKLSPRGSTVRISAHCGASDVAIAVADEGPGIACELLPCIFEPFWCSARKSRGGTGLGLFIARGIVEAQGGRLCVESSLGAGAVFTFTLPLA